MSTNLVKQTGPGTADQLITTIVHARTMLRPDVIQPGPTIGPRIEEVRRQYLAFVDTLSEHARVALLREMTSKDGDYQGALKIVDDKMGKFHEAGQALLGQASERSKEVYTGVEGDQMNEDIFHYLSVHAPALHNVTVQRTKDARPVADNGFTFGELAASSKPEVISTPFVDEFRKAWTPDFAEYVMLYVVVLDEASEREAVVDTLVDKALAAIPDVKILPQYRDSVVKTIAAFVTMVRDGKDPLTGEKNPYPNCYTNKIGDGVIRGTLPEVVPFDDDDVEGTVRQWMSDRALITTGTLPVQSVPVVPPKTKKKQKGPKTPPVVPAEPVREPILPPLSEKSSDHLEGIMVVYWNNGQVDEVAMRDKASVTQLLKEIHDTKVNDKRMRVVGMYFHDKHEFEETLILLPEGAKVHAQLKKGDKICSFARKADGTLVVGDLFGNAPQELHGVTQADILRDPFKYFSVRNIALDYGTQQ